MQRENERSRVAVVGMLVDGGGRCTVVAVHHRSPRRWVLYPHGVDKLGVELSEEGATELAEGIIQSRQ
ncbi:MAG: hypothetical protein LC808_09155 [Actinobacteria bacterium]|nr:hypothetical protein [Actinomycetota bacterium]